MLARKQAAIILISLFTTLAPVCIAQNSSSPVINGDSADLGRWPWIASIVDANLRIPKYGFHCGATLISKRYLLTAAHCVFKKGKRKGLKDWQAILGDTSLSDRELPRVAFSDIVIHPGYNNFAKALRHDLAIIRLEKPVNRQALSIWPSRVSKDTAAKVLGWGQISPTSSRLPSFLQEADLPTVADAECSRLNRGYFDKYTMICAGTLSSEKKAYDGIDACYGDSGGPLVSNLDGQWYQIGIVSSGFECASHQHYGMYTRLSHYYNWIAAHISPERELGYLVKDILTAAKVLNFRLSKKQLSANAIGPLVRDGSDRLKSLIAEYSENQALILFSSGKEYKLLDVISRVLNVVETQPNVARKGIRRAIKLSRLLKRRHRN